MCCPSKTMAEARTAFTMASRRRGRSQISSFVRLARDAKVVLLLLSLHRLHQSRAWTAPSAPSSLRALGCQPTTAMALPGQRRRSVSRTRVRERKFSTQIRGTSSTTIETTDETNGNESEPTQDDSTQQQQLSAWEILAGNVATCLMASDQKRATGMDGGSTGWTSWIEESSSFRLQQCVDRLVFGDETATSHGNNADASAATTGAATTASSRDNTLRWMKWMKSAPSPMVVELSADFRSAVNHVLTPADWERAGHTDRSSQADFLSRIGCRLVLLPSGKSLRDNLRTPPGAMVYGKLLYGGVTRYRILGGNGRRPPRKAGERTTIMPLADGHSIPPISKGWLQFGGPDRNYNAVDMGPCGLMEVTILPKDLKLGLLGARESSMLEDSAPTTSVPIISDDQDEHPDDFLPVERQPTEEMVVSRAANLDPQWLFSFAPETNQNSTTHQASKNETSGVAMTTAQDNYSGVEEINQRFSSVIGGLQPEIDSIIRRVLDGRRRSVDETDPSGGSSSTSELQTMLELGLSPVRGLLLYGKPGCGKTALAREISRLLTDRPPKIVAAPELLDRWVGGTETAVRSLFEDAEAELAVCHGDPAQSGLHVIVIDEIDAVFRQRSSSSGSGEVARASAVNQILAKLDGVQALGNILVIGTTNRRELLDDALLRPGRLEVKIEVPLPDREGRREILNIYFGPLRALGRLSQPLCRAIDGRSTSNTSVSSPSQKHERSGFRTFLRDRLSWKIRGNAGAVTMHDLAANRWTGGFSGADIEGLVRCAGSIALSRARKDGSGVDGLIITTEDVAQAIRELKQ